MPVDTNGDLHSVLSNSSRMPSSIVDSSPCARYTAAILNIPAIAANDVEGEVCALEGEAVLVVGLETPPAFFVELTGGLRLRAWSPLSALTPSRCLSLNCLAEFPAVISRCIEIYLHCCYSCFCVTRVAEKYIVHLGRDPQYPGKSMAISLGPPLKTRLFVSRAPCQVDSRHGSNDTLVRPDGVT